MTKRLAAIFLAQAIALAVLLTVALDVHLHHKFETLGALNIHGYRGPVMAARRPDELRIAVVGGTLAFGWGGEAQHTLAGYLRQFVAAKIARPGPEPPNVAAVNVAGIDLPPDRYAERLRRYAYLAPDLVCVEPDPPGERYVFRHGTPERSGVFARTGYMPVMPLIFEEKAQLLGDGPARVLVRSAGRVLDGVDVALHPESRPATSVERAYADAVADAVTTALGIARHVILVLPARYAATDPAARDGSAEDLQRRFAGERRVAVVDFGQVPEMNDARLWLDRLALGAGGHSKTAELLAPVAVELISR